MDGAGLAGLSGALSLVAAGKSVTVLEARDRVGGRTEGGVMEGAVHSGRATAAEVLAELA